jgi:membrane protein insertase Oxa1/YidC/SpoIIIJ
MFRCCPRQLCAQTLRVRGVNCRAAGAVLSTTSGHSLLPRRQASTEAGFFGDNARLCFESIHSTTGLPWWATLPMCAVAMRVSLAPLSVLQRMHIERLHSVSPQLREAWAEREKEDSGNLATKMRSILKAGNCRPYMTVLPIFAQIGVFITATFGVRCLCMQPGGPVLQSLRDGGLLWFTDLTIADATLALPLVHTSLILLNLELGLGSIATAPPKEGAEEPPLSMSRIIGGLHTTLNLTMLVFFPLISQLPQAVFLFWITSSVTSMGLNPLIRAGTPQQQRLPPQQKSATPQQQSLPPQQKSAAPGSIAPTAKTVTVNEQLAKELKHVQAVIAEAEWARNAPATKRLRDRIQNLVNAERALLTSLAPPHNLHNLQRYDDVFSITVQSP